MDEAWELTGMCFVLFSNEISDLRCCFSLSLVKWRLFPMIDCPSSVSLPFFILFPILFSHCHFSYLLNLAVLVLHRKLINFIWWTNLRKPIGILYLLFLLSPVAHRLFYYFLFVGDPGVPYITFLSYIFPIGLFLCSHFIANHYLLFIVVIMTGYFPSLHIDIQHYYLSMHFSEVQTTKLRAPPSQKNIVSYQFGMKWKNCV